MDNPTKRFFNERAAGWMRTCWHDYFLGNVPDMDARIDRMLDAAGVRENSHVLDVGCGDGILVPFILQRLGPDGRVTELDFAERMIEENRRLHDDARIDFLVRDITDDLGSRRFDAVIAFSCFPHFQDPALAVRRLAELTQPGGTVTVCHLKSSAEMNEFHREAHPDVARDRLPPAEVMIDLFRVCGLVPLTRIDSPGLYLVAGRARGVGMTT